MSVNLRHLNGDTSWLIGFNGFHLLVDPWFFGCQSDYSRYFSCQKHSLKPSIENVNRDLQTKIDIIVISHEFSDHCHEETLRSLSPSIPVFARHNAMKVIRRWNHFENIIEIPILDNSPESNTLDKLIGKNSSLRMSNEISIGYLPEKGIFSLPSLHGATSICFLVENIQWKSLLYIPHGCKLNSISEWLNKQSNVNVSILLQGFDRVYNPIWLGGLLNYGYIEGSNIAISLQVKHWIATHDEQKIATGFVSKFLKRDYSTMENARLQLNKLTSSKDNITILHDIPNGDSLTIDL